MLIVIVKLTLLAAIWNSSSELLLNQALSLASDEILLRPGPLLLSTLPCRMPCSNIIPVLTAHDTTEILQFMCLYYTEQFSLHGHLMKYFRISNFLSPDILRLFFFLKLETLSISWFLVLLESRIQNRFIGLRTHNNSKDLFYCSRSLY